MRSSKDRTIQKKRVNKANKVAKTERSRKQRIANKHRREEIHAIDSDMKVIVINQKTFDKHGTEIEVIDGKIRAVLPPIIDEMTEKYGKTFNIQDPSGKLNADFDSAVVEYQEVLDNEAVIEKIETRNKSAFKRLTDKLRGD